MNRSIAEPGKVLGQYDLIFAQGRSALEALACGAAVMICSSRAFGPLVTEVNFDSLRQRNFGIRTLLYPVSAATVIDQLSHYSPSDALAVTKKTRLLCSVEDTLDELLTLYRSVIHEEQCSPLGKDEEGRAAARYLQKINLQYKMVLTSKEPYLESSTSLNEEKSLEKSELERTHLKVQKEVLFSQLEEMATSNQRTQQEMKESALWSMRKYLLKFRGMQWCRQVTHWLLRQLPVLTK